MNNEPGKVRFLECEKRWFFWILIFIGGFYGAYTYSVRGGIFCNAQTANVVLFSMAIGTGDWNRALYLILPISSYFLGTIVSEIFEKVKIFHHLRWDTVLVGIEIIIVIILGALPESAPDQICHVSLNFLCSMRFNTYRQNEGIPMSTVFVTNHIRQTGSCFVKSLRDKDPESTRKWKMHGIMIVLFLMGGIASSLLCTYLGLHTIWCTLPVLIFTFIKLLIADCTYEKELLGTVVPRGH